MAQRPVQMAFPSGDIMRRSATPRIVTDFGGRGVQVTPASTITESVLPDPSFADVMARTAAARQARALQQQRQMQQQQTGGPFLPARPEGMPGISPRGRGALAAAMAGLQYAGPQAQPTSFAQGLGVMGQAAVEAYDRATTAQAEQEALEFEKLYKIADLDIKAAKATGGMFKGSGFKPGAFNMIIDLAPKIKAGTATPAEEQAYSLAYGEVSAPTTRRFFDEDGNETIETIPGANMSQFPKPAGFVEPTATVKPSAQALKQSKYATQLQTMANNLNRYRSMLMMDTFDRADMISGAAGTPTDEMAQATSLAEALRLDLKTLYELGALVGGDFQILDNLLTSPNSVKAAKAGKTSVLLQLDQLERTLEGKLKETDNLLSGTYSTPIKVEDRSDWDEVPVGSYAILGNGDIVYKER